MNGIALNNMKYTGIVNISQYTDNKMTARSSLHTTSIINRGGASLFNFFSNCLAGDFVLAELDRPVKIMLLKITKDTNNRLIEVSKGTQYGFIQFSGLPEKIYDENMCRVRYSFKVTSNFINNNDSDFNAIGLYTATATENTLQNFAALVELDEKIDMDAVKEATMLTVDWELNISNSAGG